MTPTDTKYNYFKPEFTAQYTYVDTLTAAQIKTGMQTFAADWIVTNYPEVI